MPATLALEQRCRRRFELAILALLMLVGASFAYLPVTGRRAVTMLPSLIFPALAVNPSQALVYSQIVLSFGIPFALVPLLPVSRDRVTLAGKSATSAASRRRPRTPAGSSRRASTASFLRAADEARQFMQAPGRLPYLGHPGGLEPYLTYLGDGVVVP